MPNAQSDTFPNPNVEMAIHLERVRRDNARCIELLNQWKSQFPTNYNNVYLKLFRKGEGLTQEFLKKPRTRELGPGCFDRHPDLHPTAYQSTDPNDIRLILPVRGLLPMGCAKGVPGYGMIHPNLINAAVLQCYGLTAASDHFDAMSLAPNFDLLLTQQKATNVARLIAEWNREELDLGERGELVVQSPPVPQVIQHFCHTGLSQQAVTQDHPLGNSQTEAHKIYDELVTKYRDALRAVKEHLNSKKNWVELMKLSEMDDGPEVAVDVHLDDSPAQISSIKTRIKSLATGVWDLLKRLTEYMAPTVVKTPATSATTEILEPEIDPVDFGLSVPENTLITRQHNRRFDWNIFARDLMIETLIAKVEDKPVIHHKAPPVFTWPENQSWNCMDRIAPRLTVPTPDPWSNTEYIELAESAIDPLATRPKDAASAFNNWIWTWAYVDPNLKGDDNRLPD